MRRIISLLLASLLITASNSFPAGKADMQGDYVRMTGIFQAFEALINKKKILAAEYRGEPSVETWSETDKYDIGSTAVLIKEKNKDFVILNITDVHFSDYDIRALMAFPASATIKRLVKEIKPDLITVTGDFVCGDSTVYSIMRFTDLMESFGIPWAPVFGNHDAEANCDRNYLADIMLKSKHCLLKKGPAELGEGNYIINIAEQNGEKLEYVHSLIMMDTHKTHLWDNQIEWYKWAAQGIGTAAGYPVESSVFFHIPCAEYQYAYDEAWNSEKGCWRNEYEATGEYNEKICCHRDANGEPVNNGFFAAVKQVGTTKNIICGHEHMNNFSILYQGVRLTYTLKVGKGSGYQPGFNGGTVIAASADGLTLEHIYK